MKGGREGERESERKRDTVSPRQVRERERTRESEVSGCENI